MKNSPVLRWLSAALFVCGVLSVSWGLEGKRAWRAEDSFGMKEIRDLAVSPNSKVLLFVVSETDPGGTRARSAVWVIPTQGGAPKRLTDAGGSVSSPRWSPDGGRIAYFASDHEGLGLWVMREDGSQKKKLTRLDRPNTWLGEVGNALCWSPDGKQLAFNAAGPQFYSNKPSPQHPPNENDVMYIDRLQYKAAYYYSDMRRTYVYLISAEGGKPRQISFGEEDYHSISWSPDGRWIACVSNRTGRDDYNSNNDICLLSTTGKELVQLTHTIGPEYQPVWSPDGSRIAYLGRLRDHRSKESDAELKKVYVISPTGKDTVNLTGALDRWSAPPEWSADSKTVYFMAQNYGRVNLYSAPATGGKVTPLVDEEGQVRDFSVSRDGRLFYAFSDLTNPPEIFRANPDGSAKRRLTDLNKRFKEEVEIIKAEEFAYPSFDGLSIQGWLLRPRGFQQGKKYPMILDIHGGPHGQYGYTINGRLQYYAANGYVVVYTNPRGSTGRGQAFSDLCVGDLGGGDYRDLMAGVDYVLQTYPFVDSKRMGVTGISYGGYMTNWVITHTGRFKAAVPISSISNLISMWGTGCNTDWFESDMGLMPIDDFEKAWSVSPLKYIKNCRTPTMFVAGQWDFVTTLYQAEEMFTALKKMGIDAAIASYPNEGHGVRNQPRHGVDYYKRSLAWFDRYLK
jgi:dipeptidyl aminopeptidase/acylaminoacyl peptidase